jgi:hypothetical protein
MHDISAFFLSRSGEQLYLRDTQGGSSKPLLYHLATPEYTDALNKFKNVDIYVNCVSAVHELLVPANLKHGTLRSPMVSCPTSVAPWKNMTHFSPPLSAPVNWKWMPKETV